MSTSDESLPISDVHPIFPSEQQRDLLTRSTRILFDRLLQSLDDEHNDLNNIAGELKHIAEREGIDYETYTNNILNIPKKEAADCDEIERILKSISIGPTVVQQTGSDDINTDEEGNDELLDDEDFKAKQLNYNSEYENERADLLGQLHNELKLTSHYESLLSQYETLLAYTLDTTRKHRQQVAQQKKLHEKSSEVRVENLKQDHENLERITSLQKFDISHSLYKIETGVKELKSLFDHD